MVWLKKWGQSMVELGMVVAVVVVATVYVDKIAILGGNNEIVRICVSEVAIPRIAAVNVVVVGSVVEGLLANFVESFIDV